ncbi:MAG: fumarylacetoacetate hydrolase family protein [Bacteroidetes bacterium]|nr:fumarylacetoacetate hydrolase family protein [Bacteroidota bacterium]
MKIICVGRNYLAHIKELGNTIPAEPVFFLKPETALLIRNRPFVYPEFSTDIHYEVELVLKIRKSGRKIDPKFAHNYYSEIGLGIDFTARDIQNKAKKAGLPWFTAKGFDHAAPVSQFLSKSTFPDVTDISFHLDLNGETVQRGNTSLMIYPFNEIIAQASRFVTLRNGDLIYTGTPAGVGPVKIGDTLEGYIEGEKLLKCNIISD